MFHHQFTQKFTLETWQIRNVKPILNLLFPYYWILKLFFIPGIDKLESNSNNTNQISSLHLIVRPPRIFTIVKLILDPTLCLDA